MNEKHALLEQISKEQRLAHANEQSTLDGQLEALIKRKAEKAKLVAERLALKKAEKTTGKDIKTDGDAVTVADGPSVLDYLMFEKGQAALGKSVLDGVMEETTSASSCAAKPPLLAAVPIGGAPEESVLDSVLKEGAASSSSAGDVLALAEEPVLGPPEVVIDAPPTPPVEDHLD